jgi:hypothetical protein
MERMLLVSEDVLRSVAGWLTREEAGLLLAPLCRAGAEVVRAGDGADDEADSVKSFWQWELAPWALFRSQPRIAARYPEGGSLPGLCMVLQSLNLQLYHLEQDGLVEMVFDRRAACAGQQASVLGCHTLRVLDAYEFLTTMQCWVMRMRKTRTEWRSKWGLFGWANARRGAQWVRKEKPPFHRGRPRHFQLVGLPTFCETASATLR